MIEGCIQLIKQQVKLLALETCYIIHHRNAGGGLQCSVNVVMELCYTNRLLVCEKWMRIILKLRL